MVLVDGSAEAAQRYADLGGIFIQSGSTVDPSYADLQLLSIPPLVAVDQEGGRVQGMRQHLPPLVSAHDMAQTMTESEVRELGAATGAQLRDLGITMDFAPVADLYPGSEGGVIGDRGFATDPDDVTAYAEAFGSGLLDAGITPTLKHFPGHGRASGNSHTMLPTTPVLADLEGRDLRPYASILPRAGWAVMVGHLDVPGLTEPGVPASIDPAAYAYLRDTLGFDGLVVTDELTGMKAVSEGRSTAESVVAALAAGADLALMANPGPIDDLVADIRSAVEAGDLSRSRLIDAATHVLALKTCRP